MQTKFPEDALLKARIFQAFIIITVLICLAVSLLLFPRLEGALVTMNGGVLLMVEICVAVLALAALVMGVFMSRVTRGFFVRTVKMDGGLMLLAILRMAYLEFIGLAGLILAVLGSGMAVTLPFFLVSLITLLLTFPSRTGWQKMLESQGDVEGSVS